MTFDMNITSLQCTQAFGKHHIDIVIDLPVYMSGVFVSLREEFLKLGTGTIEKVLKQGGVENKTGELIPLQLDELEWLENLYETFLFFQRNVLFLTFQEPDKPIVTVVPV